MTLIAWLISHHGFVHVAWASTALAALQSMVATVQSDIFTHVPPWFLKNHLADILGTISCKPTRDMFNKPACKSI